MKRNIIIGVLLAAIGVAGVTWVILKNRQAWFGTETGVASLSGEKAAGKGAGKRPGALADAGDGTATSAVKRAARASWTALDLVDGGDKLSDKDKQLVKDLQEALDDENLKGVTAAARQLMHSGSVEARVRTVTALSWFGVAALPEMVEMLSDPSAEVAEAATSATVEAISGMDDGSEKAEMIEAFIMASNDSDAIQDVLMHLLGIDDEIALPIYDRLLALAQNDPAKLAILTKGRAFQAGESAL